MKCDGCGKEFEEREIQESHNVPCYLFIEKTSRREKKQLADKYKRMWLCKHCHQEYELALNKKLIIYSSIFGEEYFKDAAT